MAFTLRALVIGLGILFLLPGLALAQSEETKLVPKDGDPRDRFGESADLDGNTIIMGAFRDDEFGNDAGAAYIFRRTGDTWTEEVKLGGNTIPTGQLFGKAVAIKGDYALVGLPNATGGVSQINVQGAAYLYEFGDGGWSPAAEFLGSLALQPDKFGESVALTDEFAFVGALDADPVERNSGAVYIYKKTEDGQWAFHQLLTPDDAQEGDSFGWALEAEGDLLVVGARDDDDVAENAGSAYVFQYDGAFWGQIQKLTVPNADPDDSFGEAVAFDGTTIVVGARDANVNGIQSGAVYVFEPSATDLNWSLTATLVPDAIGPGMLFGNDVAVSGNRLISSSRIYENNQGVVYVYTKEGNTWVESDKIFATDGESGDLFGHTIALSPSYIVSTAKGADASGLDSGAGYVYTSANAEKDALIALYDALNGGSWKNNTNWLSDTPLNEWYGVTTGAGGEVTVLDLSENGLTGSIPDVFGSLPDLVTLLLHTNELTGELPSSLGLLSKLQTLELYTNALGPTLPAFLGDLGSLEKLSLGENIFSGSVPAEFANLTSLRELYFTRNQLSGAIPEGMTQLQNLEILRIHENFFDHLPDFGNTGLAAPLTSLRIHTNKFTFEDIEPNIGVTGIEYIPQRPFGEAVTLDIFEDDPIELSFDVGGANNQYQWSKDGETLAGETSATLSIAEAALGDAGVYILTVTNTVVAGLTLESEPITVSVTPVSRFSTPLLPIHALPNISTGGDGAIGAALANQSVAFAGTFSNLPHPLASASVHIGDPADQNESIGDLTFVSEDGLKGDFFAQDNIFPISDDEKMAMEDENVYVVLKGEEPNGGELIEMIRGQLYTDPNSPPSASTITDPADGSSLDLNDGGSLSMSWTPSLDAQGHDVIYFLGVSIDAASVLSDDVTRLGSNLNVDIPFDAIDAFLAGKGIGPGEVQNTYFRILSSDGSIPTIGNPIQIAITRRRGNQAPFVENQIPDVLHLLTDPPFKVALESIFTDPDGDKLEYTTEVENSGVANVAVVDDTLLVNPTAVGATNIRVTATDISGANVSDEFTFTVNAIPQITNPISDQAVLMPPGDPFVQNLGDVFSDHEPLNYEVILESEETATASISDDVLTVTPVAPGFASIQVKAEDPYGEEAIDIFLFAVNARPRVVANIDDQFVLLPATAFSQDLSEIFEDEESLTFEASSSNEAAATVEIADDFLTVSPEGPGEATITVTAIDPLGASADEAFLFSVNAPPRLGATIADQQLSIPGTDFLQDLTTIFVDEDPLTFEVMSDNPDVATASMEADQQTLRVAAVDVGTATISIMAEDDKNATNQTSFMVTVDNNVITPPLTVSESINVSFGDPALSSSYALVALPGAVNMPLADAVSGTPETDWVAFWETGGNGEPETYFRRYQSGSAFNFVPGRGFWLLAKSTWSRTDSRQTVQLNDQHAFTIPIHSGWNIISNPFDIDLAWPVVQQANGINSPLHRWNGSFSTVQLFASARTGRAYYFFNNTERRQLVLPYIPAGTLSIQQFEGLSLTGVLDDSTQAEIRVAFHPDAREGVDALDQQAPPSNFAPLSLHLLGTDRAPDERNRFLYEEQKPETVDGHRFDVALAVPDLQSVSLTASGQEHFPGQHMVLYDLQYGKTFDLRAEPAFRFHPESAHHQFVLLIGSAAFVAEQQAELAPKEMALLPAFPNPFQQAATFSYSLPEQASVRLVVYDVIGRELITLDEGEKTAGFHSIQWDGRDGQGNPMASGVYFYQLVTERAAHTSSVVLMR